MRTIYFFFLSLFSFATLAQITFTPNPTPQEVTGFLQGADIVLSNLTISCADSAYGFFDGSNSNIGIENGMALTTGLLEIMAGPNDTETAGWDNGYPGDVNLSADAGYETYNACVIEFDCVPEHNAILFDYIFGSDEYLEWVGSPFNDIFAIYFSGEGIDSLQNFALIPGTSQPVAINTVNDTLNADYFVNNEGGTTVQYDGFTTLLTSFVPVSPGENYHVKIAIADASDGVWDSGVMFTIYSFRSMSMTSINETNLRKPQVFPNPAREQVNVVYQLLKPESVSFSLTDIAGKNILSETSLKSEGLHNYLFSTFDLQIPAGIYLLNVQTATQRFTEKIIIAE